MSITTTYDWKSDADKAEEKLVQSEGQRLEAIYDQLAIEGGKNSNPHEQITSHNGRQIMLPTGMKEGTGAQILARKAQADEEPFQHVGQYKFKPWDGAVALKAVLDDLFGAAVTAVNGTNTVIEVPIDAHGSTLSVPWGALELKWRDKKVVIELDNYTDEEYGMCFQAVYHGIDEQKFELMGLSQRVQKHLENYSIYKGKSIMFSKFRSMPDFVDPYTTDEKQVAYARPVKDKLERAIFGRLRTQDKHRVAGLPVTQKVLLAGDYGVGKTLALNLTAQKANEAGFTYIQTRAGEDNLEEVKAFAKLYAPALIGIEDADHFVDITNDPQGRKLTAVLEAFDGASTKNAEIGIVMTTNHYDDFPAPMRRQGRIDKVIHIGAWDAEAFKIGVASHFGKDEIEDIDWEVVSEAMNEFSPAFIIATLGQTRSAAIVRTGEAFGALTTEDFLAQADEVREQFDEFVMSKEFEKKDSYYETQQAFQQEAMATLLGDGTWVVDLENGQLTRTV